MQSDLLMKERALMRDIGYVEVFHRDYISLDDIDSQ